MVRSLSVMYLHRANRLDAKRLPLMEYGLTDAFRDFCRETFDARGALDYPPLKQIDRMAIIMGTEGDGLPTGTIREADYVVRIPMAHGVDSLNVAAASAVAFWELCR